MEKSQEELRNQTLTLRLTKREMEMIEQTAREAGIPKATYARIATMRAAKRDAMRADDDDILLL